MTPRIENALRNATDTKVFELGENILDRVPAVFSSLFPGRDAVLIVDCNTWRVAGEKVFALMRGAGIPTTVFHIPDEHFHAEWKYIEMVDKVLDDTGAVAVSVGSGVINDLCKLCSYHHGQSYLSVPTAASVDGYSSFGASISYKGLKQTFECPAPVAIVADVEVIATAPAKMTAAGYADLAAKNPCGAEWMIADLFGTEPIIPEAWHMLQDVLDEMLASAEGVAKGDLKAISLLFEGLTLSGFAMQAARSSRPASCTDHLFSHYLDMTGHTYKGELQSHGFQVAIGTLTMCAFFDEFLKFDLTKLDVDKCVAAWPSLEEEHARARKIFEGFVDPELGVRSIDVKYADKEGVREQLTKVRDQWPELREKYRRQVYPFEKMQRLFRIVGAPADPSDIGLTRAQLLAIVPYTQLMRHRINLLDLAKRAGIYDELVGMVFGKGGAWDLSLDAS
ncbi:MAG: sn-glycerol-1-phosphate dehydrogenase [Bacteroidales bacterium]|jgi:glycerol-1-phosphate dehydrogenase [NAD(P)+]|nr:sn-glycerol-1-phosphate dehydrogenase [Bacteroidales bacterium]